MRARMVAAALLKSLRIAGRELRRVREQNEARSSETCATCGQPFYGSDLYMLHDRLWSEVCARAGLSTDALVCVLCASLHLGRPFQLTDFSPAPVNRTIRAVWWFAVWPEHGGST